MNCTKRRPGSERLLLATTIVILTTITIAWGPPAAAMEAKATLAEIAHSADLVVLATVVDTKCRFNEEQTMIFTDVILEDADILHASDRSTQTRASRILLTYAGGRVGIRAVSVSGAPRFEVGLRYLLFLLDDGKTYANPLVGGSQAQFRIVKDAVTDDHFLLNMSGNAVLGIVDGDVAASRSVAIKISNGSITTTRSDQEPSRGLSEDAPIPSDSQSSATSGLPSDKNLSEEQPISLQRFVDQLNTLLDDSAPADRVFRFSPNVGRFFAESDGGIVEQELVGRSADQLRGSSAAWGKTGDTDWTEMGDATPRSGSAETDGLRGGTLGYCGYHDLNLTMQQLPESWWEWGVNNSGMWDWNQIMDVYRYIDSDGYYGDNNENEFCAYVNDLNLSLTYGFSWGTGIAMCITWEWCECCEILQSDILWNAAYSWTNNWEWSIGNNSVIYLAPVNMHELGHSWGMQRGPYVETYAYDQPTVMHSYYHHLVENGRGIHRPEAYCIRRLYDDQISIRSTRDIGVESYWASNGLNNAYASPTTVHPGNTVSLYGVTVENISYTAVADLRIRFWLSTNRTISTGDYQLGGYWYWTSFSAETYNVGNYSMTVPTVPAGQYFIGAMVTMSGFGSDDYTSNNTSSFLNRLTVLPAAPSSVAASDGSYNDRIRVTWSEVAGATGYDVYRRSCSTCTPVKIGSTTTTYFNDMAALAPRCAYYYYVKATSAWGTSYSSTQNSGYRQFQTPTGLYATDNQPNSVYLSWSPVYGATSYNIFRGGCVGPLCIYLDLGATSSTFIYDATASPGYQYYYYIKASNSCGTSPTSATTAGSVALPAPVGVSASDGAFYDKVSVTWTAVTNATSYDVWRGPSQVSITKIGNPTGTTFDDTTAVEGTPYYYFVAARSSIGAGALSTYNTGFRAVSSIFLNGFESGDFSGWSSTVP